MDAAVMAMLDRIGRLESDVTRLSAGQVPTAPSLIQSYVLTGAASAIDFTNIPQTFTNLYVVASLVHTTGADSILLQFSNDGTTWDTAANYDRENLLAQGTTASAQESRAASSITVGSTGTLTSVFAPIVFTVHHYTNDTKEKAVLYQWGRKDTTSANGMFIASGAAFYRNANPIKGLRLVPSTSTLAATSAAALYGLPG